MEVCSAIETVVFFAHRAFEFEIVFLVFLIKEKSELAIGSRAPRYIFLRFKGIFELELRKLGVSYVV
jgi:hypothetical protein